MNIISIIGRLTADPEVRLTKNEKVVCNFSIAVDDGWGENKKTFFFRCTAWNKAGDNIGNHLSKGQRIGITGKLTSKTYDTKEGEKRSSVEIQVIEFDYIEKKASAPASATTQASTPMESFAQQGEEEVIPF